MAVAIGFTGLSWSAAGLAQALLIRRMRLLCPGAIECWCLSGLRECKGVSRYRGRMRAWMHSYVRVRVCGVMLECYASAWTRRCHAAGDHALRLGFSRLAKRMHDAKQDGRGCHDRKPPDTHTFIIPLHMYTDICVHTSTRAHIIKTMRMHMPTECTHESTRVSLPGAAAVAVRIRPVSVDICVRLQIAGASLAC